MGTFRTDAIEAQYKQFQAEGGLKTCGICASEPIKLFKHWKIVPNNFPYNRIARVHHMIVPLRHAVEDEITAEEWKEYHEIKKGPLQDYEFIIEATLKKKSIPGHFHLHLILVKDFE